MAIQTMPLELAREIARQGDARLVALMNLATAADLRATTLFGILGAASVGIGTAVLAAMAANTGSDHPFTRLIWAGIVTALGLFAGAIISAVSGAPRDFYVTGGDPDSLRQWSWTDDRWRSEVDMLDATAQRYAVSIARNKRILQSGSVRVNCAIVLALASPVVGTAVYFWAA